MTVHDELLLSLQYCCGTVSDKTSLLELAAQARDDHNELFAALDLLLPWAEAMGGIPGMRYTGDHPLVVARAVIAKAKGR